MSNLTEEFLAFCRSKPAEEEYNYYDCDRCAFAQFARASGHPKAEAGGCAWWPKGRATGRPEESIPEPVSDMLSQYPFTFGALTARLEALAEQVPA